MPLQSFKRLCSHSSRMEMSIIRILKPGDELALEAFLLPQVESSMFLIGNMRAAGLADHGQTYQGTYTAKLEGGKIVGVVAHYWNQNLVLQATVDLVALCAEAVRGSGRPIRGLIGPGDQVGVANKVLDYGSLECSNGRNGEAVQPGAGRPGCAGQSGVRQVERAAN
jgi:hypothetical protein